MIGKACDKLEKERIAKMRVIEVCQECGADIIESVICTNPPIPVRRCTKCNWKWEGEQEEAIRVPFNPDGYDSIEFPEGSKCPCRCSGDEWYSWYPDDDWYCADGEKRNEE